MIDYEGDIEKYLSGKLTNAERHRLEKKALSDPFLAEALEGAASLGGPDFSNDLNEIHKEINLRKRSSLFWSLRIAAGIIVVVSITVITINLTENETDNQLALQKQNPPVENLPAPKKSMVDPAGESSQVEQQAPASGVTRKLPQQPAISEKPQIAPEEDRPTAGSASAAPSQADQDLKESEIIGDELEEQKTELSKVKEAEEKIEATPSNNERAKSAPSAVRSLGLSKKSEAASGASIAKDDVQSATELSAVSILPMPIGGIPQFNKYVEDNIRYPQRALNNNIEGDVIVEFRINANGSYRNFEILKGLGYGCNEEAIRLIKDGPKWSPAYQDGKVIDNKAHVTIPFRLKKIGN